MAAHKERECQLWKHFVQYNSARQALQACVVLVLLLWPLAESKGRECVVFLTFIDSLLSNILFFLLLFFLFIVLNTAIVCRGEAELL